MKAPVLKFITLVAVLTSTAMAEMTAIPANKLEVYKKAVVLAGKESNNKMSCETEGSLRYNLLEIYIKQATSASIDSSGAQPVFVFEEKWDETRFSRAIVSSSADYKQIINIKVQELQLDDVNKGDLLNPSIQKQYKVKATGECKQ